MRNPSSPSPAALVLDRAGQRNLRIATAESCTGGLIAGALTAIPGSSAVFERGFVTYSNAAKAEMLGVDADLIARVGAVSEEVARAMARGAVAASRADLAVAVTGIAGPDGGTPDKPVGLVHIATAGIAELHRRCLFPGDRTRVRAATVETALALLLAALDQP